MFTVVCVCVLSEKEEEEEEEEGKLCFGGRSLWGPYGGLLVQAPLGSLAPTQTSDD